MPLRIEFQERVTDLTQEKMDDCDRLGLPYPKQTYSYRRISIRLSDIFGVKELAGKTKHCAIEFYDETAKPDMVVKGNYDDILQQVEDREKLEYEEDLIIDTGEEEGN